MRKNLAFCTLFEGLGQLAQSEATRYAKYIFLGDGIGSYSRARADFLADTF